jgi:hypothetical protein
LKQVSTQADTTIRIHEHYVAAPSVEIPDSGKWGERGKQTLG